MSEGFIKAICCKKALFARTTFLQISQMQSAGIIIILTLQTCWDHVSLTIRHFFPNYVQKHTLNINSWSKALSITISFHKN